MKIRPVGAELFQADRQTDMTKLTVPFRNFANAPKIQSWAHYKCFCGRRRHLTPCLYLTFENGAQRFMNVRQNITVTSCVEVIKPQGCWITRNCRTLHCTLLHMLPETETLSINVSNNRHWNKRSTSRQCMHSLLKCLLVKWQQDTKKFPLFPYVYMPQYDN